MAQQNWTDIRQGNTSPSADDPAELQSFDVGSFRLNNTPGSSILGWRCSVAGHAGTWEEVHGGVGGPITLRAAYLAGAVALDQTLPLSDADGGGVILDGSAGTFTGALSLRINSATGGPFVVDRANAYIGLAAAVVTAPAAPLEIGVSNGSLTSILLSQAAHQRIEKTGATGLSIVVPNTSNPAVNWLDFVMGSTSKIKIEPGSGGGPGGVITFNNNGTWLGTFAHFSTGETIITQQPVASSDVTVFRLTGAARSNQAGGEQLADVLLELNRSVGQAGGSVARLNAIKILAPTYTSAGAATADITATMWIDGAPGTTAPLTATQVAALYIGSANGGGVRLDGLGSTGLVKNINNGLLTIGVAGTDYLAPFSLTNESVVVSGGGSVLTEDNPYFYYRVAQHKLHNLGQSVHGSAVGSYGAGTPMHPTITFYSEYYPDPTDSVAGYPRDTGFYGIADGHFGVTSDGAPSTTFMSMGLYTYAVAARYLYGGTENGRLDSSPLVIYGGSDDALTGLQFRATSTFSATSGTQYGARFRYTESAGGFAPTSGTAAFNAVAIDYEVDQTGGANGRMCGLNIEATKTTVVGEHFGLRVGDSAVSALRVDPGLVSGNTFIHIGEVVGGLTGAAGVSATTAARSALWYLDNAANAWQSNRAIWGIAGTAAAPSFAFSTAQTSGMFLYAANQLGFATDGRYVFNLFSNATSRYLTIGEASTGITGFVQVTWQSNVRQAYIYLDDTAGSYLTASPNFAVAGLSAGGLVKANATTGLLALASASDISTALGLTGPAVVFTNGSGVLTVDATNFVFDDAANRLSVTSGVIAGAGSATTAAFSAGAANVGTYRYAADILGITAGGYVALFAKVGTGNYVTIGELSTGITGAQLAFQTNALTAFLLLDSTAGNIIQASPAFAVSGLAAGGLLKATAPLGQLALASGADVAAALTLTGPAVVFTNGSGALTVDTTNFVFDNTADRLSVTGGVVAGAGSATTTAFATGAAGNGIYQYATNVLGIAANGYVAHFAKVSTNTYFSLGEQSTGLAWAQITWMTNLRQVYLYLDNSVGNVLIASHTVMGPVGSSSAPGLAVGEVGIGLYRVSSGILGLAGTSIDAPTLAAGGMVKAAVTTGRLSVAVAETDYVPPSTPRKILQLGAVFTPITDFNGNPHWVGTGVNDVSVNYAIKHRVSSRSGNFGTLRIRGFVNRNTLDGDFDVHVIVDGTDLGVLATVTAGSASGFDASPATTISDGSTIELKLTDSTTGPNITVAGSGSLDIRVTFWGMP